MKKQILTFMLGTAVLAATPLYAARVSKDLKESKDFNDTTPLKRTSTFRGSEENRHEKTIKTGFEMSEAELNEYVQRELPRQLESLGGVAAVPSVQYFHSSETTTSARRHVLGTHEINFQMEEPL